MVRRLFLTLLFITALAAALPAWAAPNDPAFDKQWGLVKVQAEQAWNTSAGKGITVAVLDTGVELAHPDLRDRDGGAYNCVGGGCRPDPSVPHFHGTHVAGIIGATANNAIGIASVAPEVKILSLQVCPGEGCDLNAIKRGLRFAADKGADVINMSLGGMLPGQEAITIGDDINYAWDKGAVVAAASGNDSLPVSSYAGAAPEKVLLVGATGPRDEVSRYSTGTAGLDVDIYAPGGNPPQAGCSPENCILSTLPKGGYGYAAGTSMAAPHAAGVAALLRCVGRDNASAVARMIATADRVSGIPRVNAAKAVAGSSDRCAASFPGDGGGGTTSGGGTSSKGTKPVAGAPPRAQGTTGPGQPAVGQPQPTNTGPTYVDPTPKALGSEDKKKGVSSQLVLNLGIGAVLLAGVIGYFVWHKRRLPPLPDDDL